jgi:hypothetical protein
LREDATNALPAPRCRRAAAVQEQADGALDPLAQLLVGFRDLAAEDIGAQRTVDQRVLELVGKEVRIHRTDLSVLHGIGEHVGDQPARVKLVVAIGARQLRELMRLG